MLELREAEERRRVGAERPFHRGKTLLDFVLGHLIGHLLAVQIGVRPGVRTDGVAGRQHLTQDLRMIGGVLADREEHRLGAFVGERLQHRGRVARPRTVVEGQHDFLRLEEIELLEMLEAEARSARGVDLDHAGDAERVRIGAGRLCGSCGRWRRHRGKPRRQRGRGLDIILGGKLLGAGEGRGGLCRHCLRGAASARGGRSNTKLRRSRPPQQYWPASGRTHYASLLFPNTQLTETELVERI